MTDTQPLHAALVVPSRGRLTWDAEGSEGGRYHSRKLHVPSSASGLTLGRGYDMKHRSKTQIAADLVRAGLDAARAKDIAEGAGLSGASARKFISDNALENFEITPQAQLILFNIAYDFEESEVRRICLKATTVRAYGTTNWGQLDVSIKDMLTDLKFRGDYHPKSRQFLQKHVAENDLAAFGAEIIKKSNWMLVPSDRFRRRRDFMERAMKLAAMA